MPILAVLLDHQTFLLIFTHSSVSIVMVYDPARFNDIIEK